MPLAGCHIIKGNSGSGVVNSDGQIVGLLNSTMHDQEVAQRKQAIERLLKKEISANESRVSYANNFSCINTLENISAGKPWVNSENCVPSLTSKQRGEGYIASQNFLKSYISKKDIEFKSSEDDLIREAVSNNEFNHYYLYTDTVTMQRGQRVRLVKPLCFKELEYLTDFPAATDYSLYSPESKVMGFIRYPSLNKFLQRDYKLKSVKDRLFYEVQPARSSKLKADYAKNSMALKIDALDICSKDDFKHRDLIQF